MRITKSSSKTGNQILGILSATRAERLLLDWANAPETEDFAEMSRAWHRRDPNDVTPLDLDRPYQRLSNRYPDVFPDQSRDSIKFARVFGMFLRKAWRASAGRERDWYLADAESISHREREWLTGETEQGRHRIALDRFKEPPPHPTPLEAALAYFRRSADRALYCPNPDCPAPYFFATRKGQKYCSSVCALPSQREAKRRWWNENRAKSKKGQNK
jgi:hypothetical protein